MIKLIAGLLGGKTWLAWLIVAGLGLGAVGGAYWYVDHGGYSRATLEWTVKYQARENELERQHIAEVDRQAVANRQAKTSELAAIEQLRNELTQTEIQLKEQADAAANDPDADRVGLGADSVHRIDSVGRPK